jgi:hypothetical protein
MFKRINHKLLFILALTMALLLAISSIALAAVWTDQADYSPGSVVTISGGNDGDGLPGYYAGGIVNVSISGPYDPAVAENNCQDVLVGDGGNWSCAVILWADPALSVGAYTYTATSTDSNGNTISEEGIFTDGAGINVSFNASGLPAETSVTVSYDGLNNGGNTKNGTIIFTSPGSGDAGGFLGSSTLECEFPDSISIEPNTYNLISQPCEDDGITLPAGGPTAKTTITGEYELVVPSDTTPPVISYALTPLSPDGSNGWYVSDVTLVWTVTENESPGSLVKTGCVDQNITADQAATEYSCSATSDGGTAGPVTVTIKRDATAPTDVSVSADRDPDSNSYYNHAFTATWSGSDATSGIASCTQTAYSSPDTSSGSLSGTCTDMAGNTSGSVNFTFMYDATPPTDVSVSADRDPDSNSYYNHAFTATWSGSDATSGIASCTQTAYSGPDTGSGSLSGTCTDMAGNTSGSVNFTFMYDATPPTLDPYITPDPIVLNGPATAFPNATDATSGVDIESCGIVNTSSVGEHTVSCSATDIAGNTATLLFKYNVYYAAGGMCQGSPGHQILQPINVDGTSVFKQKSTVPAKFRVCDANGESIGTPGVVEAFKLIQIVSGTGSTTVNETVPSTTPDTEFRWSSDEQQWIFNINTKSKTANNTYIYRITLNDGSTIDFQFGLK